MNKQDYNNKLEESINRYETEEFLSVEERLNRLKEVIKVAKEYNQKYKNPYKHYFMRKPIKYSNDLIQELENIISQIKI